MIRNSRGRWEPPPIKVVSLVVDSTKHYPSVFDRSMVRGHRGGSIGAVCDVRSRSIGRDRSGSRDGKRSNARRLVGAWHRTPMMSLVACRMDQPMKQVPLLASLETLCLVLGNGGGEVHLQLGLGEEWILHPDLLHCYRSGPLHILVMFLFCVVE